MNRLLERRAAAVRHRDRAAFLATVDPALPAFRRSQAALFDALASVPVDVWRYDVDTRRTRTLPASRRAQYAAAPTYVPELVQLSYALRGFDPRPTTVPMFLTFVRRPAGWLLGSDRDLDGTGVQTGRELWDFGPVRVAAGRRSLVLGHPRSANALAALAVDADRAVPAVTATWGAGWAQRVVLVVPDTATELARLLGGDREVSQLAAIATAQSGPTASPVGQRVLLNPSAFARLGARGRRIVLTHEITHVATRGVTGPAAPTWLVEGFADYVAYRAVPVPVAVAASELAADVRAGRLPARLPAAARYAEPARLASAYEEGWLACQLIAASVGPAGLVRFYRASAGPAYSTAALAGAFRDVLGTTEPAFTARWRDYLRISLS